MTIINKDTTCGVCKKEVILCKNKNERTWRRDTFVCKQWHLNFTKYNPKDNLIT